ncbi:MAG: response regulator [Thermogemmatispora sp.]|jgi:CheY-like chemotaxis protein|uniref:Response regulatory domain-containing protein n=1 Tax=Thermogemmatispora aurantia TaxID=2045279 RepID=A0A5J4K9T1_9CHLR|nr:MULTISPECIES: response regulator transcription factor [Thermogemmatispora]MBE3566718.1 response regulator [Thermogemmatispora sp.]GER85318.1 hypothetical protein KTAU_39530 [Thermogemmatispora aurantia]
MTTEHILIATSDPSLGSLLQRALQAQGYETTLCETAAAALAQLTGRKAALLIVDLALSDDTGWGLLRQARARGLLAPHATEQGDPCLPVILLSANPLQVWHRAEQRPLAYLPRLCPLGAVLRLVARACARQRGEQVAHSSALPDTDRLASEEWLYA